MSRRPERWTKQELKERLKTNGLKANDLWRGTFGGYLDLLISDPVKHYSTPAQLLYRGIYPEGSLENNFFSSGQHVLYGLDETLSLIHDFLWSAAQGYNTKGRGILCYGPAGSGKTRFADGAARAIELESFKSPVYAINGCQQHDNPLLLIPKEIRYDYLSQFGISVEGWLCPHCEDRYRDLDPEKLMDVKVERILFSEAKRRGIGSYKPSEPINQEAWHLVGVHDMSKLSDANYQDAEVALLCGELNVGNRGIVNFSEMLRLQTFLLDILLDLLQDGQIKIPAYAMFFVDEMIIGTTNTPMLMDFVKNVRNVGNSDRMRLFHFPHNMDAEAERFILSTYLHTSGNKDILSNNRHLMSPFAFDAATKFALITRYPDGSEGLSTRHIGDVCSILSARVRREKKGECVTPDLLLNALGSTLKNYAETFYLKKDDEKEIEIALESAQEYLKQITKRLVETIYFHPDSDWEAIETFDRYAQEVAKSTTGQTCDEDFMTLVELGLSISPSDASAHRKTYQKKFAELSKQGERFDFLSDEVWRTTIYSVLAMSKKVEMVAVTLSGRP